MAFDTEGLAEGVAGRLVDLHAAIARFGAFSFRPGEPGPGAPDGEGPAAARELVLRALSVASDPLNHRMMRHMAEGDTSLTNLGVRCSLPHVGVWERVGDMVQTGLAARALEGDTAGLTRAGHSLLELIDAVADEAMRKSGA